MWFLGILLFLNFLQETKFWSENPVIFIMLYPLSFSWSIHIIVLDLITSLIKQKWNCWTLYTCFMTWCFLPNPWFLCLNVSISQISWGMNISRTTDFLNIDAYIVYFVTRRLSLDSFSSFDIFNFCFSNLINISCLRLLCLADFFLFVSYKMHLQLLLIWFKK